LQHLTVTVDAEMTVSQSAIVIRHSFCPELTCENLKWYGTLCSLFAR